MGYNQASITDRQGSLFFVIISLALGPMMSSLIAFQSERVLFVREHSMGSYNTLTYYFAKLIADLPSLVVFPVLQGTITYFMVRCPLPLLLIIIIALLLTCHDITHDTTRRHTTTSGGVSI